ncbi:MAG: hypothetical protein IKU86_11965, partial [Thermoguttaceae bacterium]|nr:hypothetical protein [Thermoguttaceae bacterium]
MPRAVLSIVVSLLFVFAAGLDGANGSSEPNAPDAARPSNVSASADASSFRPGLMRVDFSLTSAKPTSWDGEIRLSRGAFSELIPLGVAPTCATAFFFSDEARTCVCLQTVAPLTFCGFETTLFAPRDARIEIKLRDRSTGATLEKTALVERLIDSSTQISFDAAGARIEIVRAPADELPARFEKLGADGRPVSNPLPARGDSPVFAPGEPFRLTVLPRSSATRLGGDLTLSLRATRRGSDESFATETVEIPLAEIQRNDAIVGDATANPVPRRFVLTAPKAEGVFEIALELRPKQSPRSTFSFAPADGRPFARRVLQGVVVSNRPKAHVDGAPSAASTFDGDLRAELLETIDPTNPGWRGAFSKRFSFPSFRKHDANGPPSKDESKSEKSQNSEKSRAPRVGLAPFGKSTAQTERNYPATPNEQNGENAQTERNRRISRETTILAQAPRATAAPSFGSLPLFGDAGEKVEFDAVAFARRWALD